ncbi:replication factor C subunit 3 family protein, partial [Necator americanus]
ACDLAELVKTEDFPHLLVYGPSGAGKRTRIHCILRELYGAGAERLRLDKKSLTTPSNRKIEIDTVSSNYHIEINPGEVGIYDRVVVQEVIKQMAQTTQISSATQKTFKVVVLMEADQLTRDAQHALRCTMEKYTMSCRLILCSESLSRIIEPLRSRCMVVRVPAPTDEEIRDVCLSVAERVRLTVPDPVLEQIIASARGNLRRALLSLEAVKKKGVPIKDNEKVPEPEWETYLRETADLILKKQSNETVLAVRERLYELISRCIQPKVIFAYLLRHLIKRCPRSAVREVVEMAALYEHRLTRGQKVIIHLEAFVVAFMDIYLNVVNSNAMET